MKRIVILGHGVAALTAAEAIRSQGFEGELTIVGDETHPPYSRPALSKAALLDDDPGHLRLPPPTHGATELMGVGAVGLDVERRTVRLDTGDELAYDGLVIATGSRARRLTDSPAEFTLRGLADMVRLRERLADRPTVLVAGGGPLGMEIASGAIDAGCQVTLVNMGPPMRAHLGAHLSERATRAARARGLALFTDGCVAARAAADGAALHVADGRVVEGDVLISAVGDQPDLRWLSGTALLTAGALHVDSRGRVLAGGRARRDIVAAGDVATFPTARGMRRIPLWTSAIDQAKVAGPALLRGDDAPALHFRPYFWTEQFGLSIKACGPEPGDDDPQLVDGEAGGDPTSSALMRWPGTDGVEGTAVAVNYRIPIPRLRRLTQPAPTQPSPQPAVGAGL